MKSIRILLVEDHIIVREGIKALFNAVPEMQIIGEADDGEQGVRLAKELRPDVVVIDVQMPRMNGAQATREIKRLSPETRVVALTMYDDKSYIRELLDAGVSGYVVKRSAVRDLIRAVHEVDAGRTFFDPIVQEKLATSFVKPAHRQPAAEQGQLSEREIQVLRRIAEGYSNKEIAEQIETSVKTVETYRARAMEKLGLRSRVDIVRYAVLRGWLQ